MKLPLSWLKEYVDFDDTIEGFSDKLTFSGIEVEGIETMGLKAEGVIVGDVVSVQPHPNADRLTLCTVFDGTDDHPVVCGAPNVTAGIKGAFAPVGTVLPDGTKIKKAKIRGSVSMGMLCAEDELGLSGDHEGLLVIDPSFKAGTPLSEIYASPETVFDLEITPNRPDCLSMIGVAREVAALYGTPLKKPQVALQGSGSPASQRTRVDVEDAEACPRYIARMIEGVTVGPSPDWMQQRLSLAGIRPINNLVDITNYVLLESGHPLHAFDTTLLDEGRIVVRRAKSKEKMVTLDGVELSLDAEVLVIADASKPVALAGIMGGEGSGIQESTKSVLLESAHFDPSLIRATSKRYELRSESSYRFERGTDIENVEWASQRAAALISELAGGQVAEGSVDSYAAPFVPRHVTCRWQRVRDLVGVDASNEDIRSVFDELELSTSNIDDTGCLVEIPSFRGDIQREIDLVEEFARSYGLDRIPTPAPRGTIVVDADDPHARAVSSLREVLVGLGLCEIVNYSLVPHDWITTFVPDQVDVQVALPNPVSQDQAVLRPSMWPQMVQTLAGNHAHQCQKMAAFEIGRVYQLHAHDEPLEKEHVSIGLLGRVASGSQTNPVSRAEMFSWLKGIWSSLIEAQEVEGWELRSTSHPGFEPGYTTELVWEGNVLGMAGLVNPSLTTGFRINEPLGVLEVLLDPLIHSFELPRSVFTPPAYPSVSRDIALLVDDHLKHAEIMSTIREAAPPELESIALFDIYTGKGVDPGKKSMAYSLTYRSAERTLTDGEANDYHDVVKEALKERLSVDIR